MVDLDPYLALAELKENARVIVFDKDVHKPNAFYIAGSDFVDSIRHWSPKLNAVFASEGRWAEGHHDEVAKAQAEATGVDIEAVKRFVGRSDYRVAPVDDEVVKEPAGDCRSLYEAWPDSETGQRVWHHLEMVAGVLILSASIPDIRVRMGRTWPVRPILLEGVAAGDGLRQTAIDGGLRAACNAFGSRPS